MTKVVAPPVFSNTPLMSKEVGASWPVQALWPLHMVLSNCLSGLDVLRASSLACSVGHEHRQTWWKSTL